MLLCSIQAFVSRTVGCLLLVCWAMSVCPDSQLSADDGVGSPAGRSATSHNAGAPPKESFQRALALGERYQGKLSRERLDWHWLENGCAWYSVRQANRKLEYYWVDSMAGMRRPLVDLVAVAAALTAELGQAVEPAGLQLDGLTVEPDGAAVLFRWGDRWWRYRTTGQQLEPAERPAGQGLPPQSRVIRSRGQGPETFIRFVNRTGQSFRLWWVKSDGSRTPYGALQPGQEREQHTFSGHAWLVTRGEAEVYAAFRAVEGGGEAILEEEMKFSTERDSARSGRASPRSANPPADLPWRVEVVEGKLLLVGKRGEQRVEL